jgi:hypothetical protein
MNKRFILSCTFHFLLIFPAFSQIDPLAVVDESAGGGTGTLQSLEAMQRTLALKEGELASLQQELAAAMDDDERNDVREKIRTLRGEIEDQRRQFDSFAADVDLSPFIQQAPSKFDWQEKVGELLEPIMSELESATAESRKIAQLRSQAEDIRKRRDVARIAVDNLTLLSQQPASTQLTARINARLAIWTRTLEEADSEYTALDIQLQSRLAGRESVVDQSTKYIRHFFRTRGLNLLLGVMAFLAVFMGFRLADHLVRRLRRTKDRKTLGSRVTTLLFHMFSVLGGLVAMMLVFNLVGDWFLLGIIIIFLIGVGWAGVHTLPQQVETIKLMLNIGAVREGEHLVYEGTRYRVATLGFSAKLTNPALDGGTRLIPVKYLVGMTSRPCGEKEEWFPSKTGDWMELSDGRTGRVLSQTPNVVQLEMLGGSTLSLQTNDYLTLKPNNLSNGFRIESTFGVDYRHQALATTKIPAGMKSALEKELPGIIPRDQIVDIQVDFKSASQSSLDYTITLDLKGEAAGAAREIRFNIQRILVDTCNALGLVIPFMQIAVHQVGTNVPLVRSKDDA